MNTNEKKKYSQKVTIIGSIADAILGFLKVLIGLVFHSNALIIDGIHSFTDVFSDIFVVIITRLSHSEPDKNHPYGHEKFETIGSALLGSILLATSGALIYETVVNLFSNNTQDKIPGWPTLVAATVSLIVKEGLFHYTYRAGEKLQSNLIKANAWHSRTDAFSSLVVFIGLIFSMMGYTWVDKLAALIVALFISHIGWGFVKESLVELAETSVDEKIKSQIKNIILAVHGVRSCHALRARNHGSKIIVDVNIEVDRFLTASEAHEISSWVVKKLKERMKPSMDVTVHMDVEDDRLNEENRQYSHEHDYTNLLPLRPDVIKDLKNAWGEEVFNKIKSLRLHYHREKIFPEIISPDLTVESSELDLLATSLGWYGKSIILKGSLIFEEHWHD